METTYEDTPFSINHKRQRELTKDDIMAILKNISDIIARLDVGTQKYSRYNKITFKFMQVKKIKFKSRKFTIIQQPITKSIEELVTIRYYRIILQIPILDITTYLKEFDELMSSKWTPLLILLHTKLVITQTQLQKIEFDYNNEQRLINHLLQNNVKLQGTKTVYLLDQNDSFTFNISPTTISFENLWDHISKIRSL